MKNLDKIFTSFRDVVYYDEPHIYYVNGVKFKSVTGVIEMLSPKFDSDYWAEQKANEYGITKENVLYSWDFLNKYSTIKGSAIHTYGENIMNRKIFPYNQSPAKEYFGYDAILNDYNKSIELLNKFYEDSKKNLVPIKTEYIVYDVNYKIAGMVDLLVFNLKSNQYEIWDYKTNKSIRLTNNYQKMLEPVAHLDDCEFSHYSLQLNIYKNIIEKYTGINIGACYLVWINSNNDNYKVIKCDDISNVEYIISEVLK